jgi:glucose-1-phosphate cytidylyltransferase
MPKPMIPIGNKPMLWHIMNNYALWGHKDFILCLGYQGQSIKDYFLNYNSIANDITIDMGKSGKVEHHFQDKAIDWRITMSDTGLNTMTGGRVKRVQKYLNDEKNFMLTYGDGIGDVDLEELIAFHEKHGRILTVTGVRPPGRFGELMSDAAGKVLEFNEKPQATAGLISGGYFVCRKEIFNYLGENEDLVFEQEPMRKLVTDGEMMVYEHSGFWQPMDTAREYKLLNAIYESGDAPWGKR